MNVSKLHEEIEKIADISGISIGIENDKSTWVVRYNSAPTDAQIGQVKTIINNCDINEPELSSMSIDIKLTVLQARISKIEEILNI